MLLNLIPLLGKGETDNINQMRPKSKSTHVNFTVPFCQWQDRYKYDVKWKKINIASFCLTISNLKCNCGYAAEIIFWFRCSANFWLLWFTACKKS